MRIIENINLCSGCGACYNTCPNNAISMLPNEEGFLYPVIDNDKCTNCGLCKKICPVINPRYDNNYNPACFAFKAKDEIRNNATSGGLFTVLAEYFIENGYYVAGAVWTQNFSVKHIVSNKIEDVEKMKKSKYLQSDVCDCFCQIKQLLDNNKQVLFSGTPCQVAGLKAYLRKDYDNLLSLDLVCHGVPSSKVFQKYIQELLKDDEILLNVDFRYKIKNIAYKKSNVNNTNFVRILTNRNETAECYSENSFIKLFLSDICLRNSCYYCKYQRFPRQGDMTIGDFWGIQKYKKSYKDELGVSLCLFNNKKAEKFYNILKKDNILFKKVQLKYAVKGNPVLTKSTEYNWGRKLFFDLLNKKTINELVNICVDDKCDYLIVNLWDSAFNYGAMLTAYAMQEMVKSFGFIPKILNTGEKVQYSWYKDSHLETFSKDYLNTTKALSYKQCKKLSKYLKGVIIGSDQVLRLGLIRGFFNKYLANFASTETKKIAIAPSFGFDKQEYLKQKIKDGELDVLKNALKSFDYLSCRESQGKEIYKDLFDLDADILLDPVFLIDKQKYVDIANKSSLNSNEKIFSYILRESKYKDAYDYLSKKFNADILEIDIYKNHTRDWLKGIINSKFVITDSFHCVCFAIMFNKPFICFDSKTGGSSRLGSLLDLFGLSNCIITDIDQIYKLQNIESISYSNVNIILQKEVNRCLTIVENVLKNNYSNNPNKEQKCKPYKYSKFVYFSKKIKYLKCKLFSKKGSYKEKARFRKVELEWNK